VVAIYCFFKDIPLVIFVAEELVSFTAIIGAVGAGLCGYSLLLGHAGLYLLNQEVSCMLPLYSVGWTIRCCWFYKFLVLVPFGVNRLASR